MGGFIWELEGLTMVLVKAAGFKASYDQPISMEEVLNGFLDGTTRLIALCKFITEITCGILNLAF